MLIYYLLSFFAGALVKLTDYQVDTRKLPVRYIEYLSSFWAGMIIAYLVSADSVFSSVFLGVIAANFAIGKVDTKAHQFMFVPIIFSIAIRGIAPPSLLLLGLFAALAFLDEYAHDRLTAKKKRVQHAVRFLAENRLFLEIFAVVVSVATGDFGYFLAIATFDLGYVFTSKLYG